MFKIVVATESNIDIIVYTSKRFIQKDVLLLNNID